ncbi:MAG: fasciclin domain-containing protein [Pseudomonadota bacterium]
MITKTHIAAPLFVVASLGLAACSTAGTTTPATPASATVQADIVDTAVSAGQFTTLVAAVQAAGLVDTLKSDGPFTVFAPTDDAFAKLPAGTVEDLLKPENRDQLTAVLTYHVIAAEVMSSDIAGKTLSAKTVQGGDLAIDATDGVKINNATVIAADVDATNGVIHVIDTVLLP